VVMLRRPVRGGFRMPSALRVEHHSHDSPSITPRQIMLVVPLRAHKPNVGRCEILHQLSATNLSAECRTYRCSYFSTLSLVEDPAFSAGTGEGGGEGAEA
jgi:hypothetical protein